jgi:hypothetical protein
MNPWIRYTVIAFIILMIFFSIAYVFMALEGKAIITKQLQELTHKKVRIGYYNLTLPLNLEIKNLNIEDVAKVEEVFLSPSLLYLLTGRIALNNVRITRPEITFERNAPQAVEAAAKTSGQVPATSARSAKLNKKSAFDLIFKHLSIKDGKIYFTDHTAGTEGIKITVKDINLSLSNVSTLPVSTISYFRLQGRIPWQKGEKEGKIVADGWINLFKRDIQAVLKVNDIDGIYLYPYYSQWVDLEKARIESAKLNFSSNIQGLNNNLTAECHLELSDIVRKPRPPEEGKNKAEKVADIVLGMLKAMDQGKIELNFTLRTKMDRLNLGVDPIKSAVEDKLAMARGNKGVKPEKVLLFPAKLLEEAVKSATDLSKAVIDGGFAIGNELKKAVKDSFKKESREF